AEGIEEIAAPADREKRGKNPAGDQGMAAQAQHRSAARGSASELPILYTTPSMIRPTRLRKGDGQHDRRRAARFSALPDRMARSCGDDAGRRDSRIAAARPLAAWIADPRHAGALSAGADRLLCLLSDRAAGRARGLSLLAGPAAPCDGLCHVHLQPGDARLDACRAVEPSAAPPALSG